MTSKESSIQPSAAASRVFLCAAVMGGSAVGRGLWTALYIGRLIVMELPLRTIIAIRHRAGYTRRVQASKSQVQLRTLRIIYAAIFATMPVYVLMAERFRQSGSLDTTIYVALSTVAIC